MNIEEEKIIEEIKKSMAESEAKNSVNCGKTPIEKRWNITEKDKPSEA